MTYLETLLLQVGNEQHPSTTACCDAAMVTVRWLGFHRIWQGSGEVFDSIDLFLPDVQFETQVIHYPSLFSLQRSGTKLVCGASLVFPMPSCG